MPPGSRGSSATGEGGEGGGGVLGLERVPTTDCGPITVECWPSRAKMAKKKEARGGGCPLIILYDRGALRAFGTTILYRITIICIRIRS